MNLLQMRVALVAMAILLVGCDHGSKLAAKRALEHEPPRTLMQGVFDLDYVENRDAGFGLLRAVPETIRTPLLTSVQLISGIALLLLGMRRNTRSLTRACLLLICAGAVGNGLDRLVRGYVVDFLYLHHWPVFNVADIYITAGVIPLTVHRDVTFENISGGVVNARAEGIDSLKTLALQSLSLFSERQQSILSFETDGARAFAAITFRAVFAMDIPHGPKQGQVLSLSGRSEFEFKDGAICRITDIS